MALNRIVTITGAGPTIAVPVSFDFTVTDSYRNDFTGGVAGESSFVLFDRWRAVSNASAAIETGASADFIDATMVSEILAAAAIDYSSFGGTRYSGLRGRPSSIQLNAESGESLYILRSDGSIGATFSITDGAVESLPRERSSFVGYRVPVTGGVANGADFLLDDASLGFSHYFRRVPAQPETTKKVWADIVEQGATSGLVQVDFGRGVEDGDDPSKGTSDADDQLFVTGVQQSAIITTRYDSDILFGDQIVDDLGRIWAVSSSRALSGRRFLEFEAFSTAETTPDAS